MWTILSNPNNVPPDWLLGELPNIILATDPAPVREQVDKYYAHGGGWSPFGAGQWQFDPATKSLTFPDDPTMMPLAQIQVRDELCLLYDHAFVAVVQADGRFDVIRMD
jgi:hypothetical protein